MNIREISKDEYNQLFELTKNRSYYCSPNWLSFLEEAKKVKFLFFLFEQDDQRVGIIPIGVFRKMIFKISASPFEGWDTENLGFSFFDGQPIEKEWALLLRSLSDYLHAKCHIHYFEIVDRHLSLGPGESVYINSSFSPIVDLTPAQEILFSSFDTDVRTNTRAFRKKGGIIKELPINESLFLEFWLQESSVYSRRGMKSIFSHDFFQKMFLSFERDKENVICFGAFSSEEKCIALIVSVCLDGEAYIQCISDYYAFLKLRPIEPLVWQTILYWKDHGAKSLNLSGNAPWKTKFKPNEIERNRYIITKSKMLFDGRNLAKKILLKLRG